MGLSDLKQHHTIWTPELVELSLPLAGIARRCVARLIDQVILTLIDGLIIVVGLLQLIQNPMINIIVCLILILLADFIYFTACHVLMDGKTPGKMCVGIRVVTERGGRINIVTSMIRSLFNYADMMLFSGGVSALMILSTAQEKRIADFTAGTLVVCDSDS